MNRERRAQKQQPWIVLKLAVFLTIALNGYAAYVYVGIFCRDMIVKNSSALGSQAMGSMYITVFLCQLTLSRCPGILVVFLIVFCILFLVVSWSYIMVSC